MAPNSEEGGRLQNALSINSLWSEDTLSKEKQRPPIYNPEDYALSLKKWCKRPPGSSTPSIYSGETGGSSSDSGCPRSPQAHGTTRDYRNLMLTSNATGEMTLRQFGTVSELLNKLRADLRLAFPSFVQEFISDPLDGVSLLLELLRSIQLSQAGGGPGGATPSPGTPQSPSGTGTCTQRVSPAAQRRALLDELACLHCLLCCCHRYADAVRRVVNSSTGLFTLAVCIMSNVNKSRVIALELLTKVCEPPSNGHSAVSEALSTLRLRFGEPVRFRFLAGMLCSGGGGGDLLSAGLRFLNTFLDTSGTQQNRLYIQAELQQAGFDIQAIKKFIKMNSNPSEVVLQEIDRWDKGLIDIQTMATRLQDAEKKCEVLKDKVKILEKRIKILQEEKGVLVSLEQCLKERCSDLQSEVNSLKTGKPKPKKRNSKHKIDDSSPAEDEGISSSERSLTPEHDIQRDSSVYEIFSVQSETCQKVPEITASPVEEEEEETTIDEVIEELRNIVNDAETEEFEAEKQKQIHQRQMAEKIVMKVDLVEENEEEIIPQNLHPQPPRKTRSLVHLYIPTEDYDYQHKGMIFENENDLPFTDESSDSLLSASKCQGVPEKIPEKVNHVPTNNNREILNTIMDARERALIQEKRLRQKRNEMVQNLKRSESFHHSNMKVLELNETNLKSVKHNSFDGMFFVTNFSNSPSSPRHSKKRSKPDLSNQKIRSKSLDRIDDGLDSMVDIVVTSEQTIDNRLHTKSDSGQFTETSISRSTSNNYSQIKEPSKFAQIPLPPNSAYPEKRMFLPYRYDSRELYKEPHFYFPRIKESSSNSFLKRGHTNAGLYSGFHNNNEPTNRTTTIVSMNSYKTNSSRNGVSHGMNHGKFADLPSGLY